VSCEREMGKFLLSFAALTAIIIQCSGLKYGSIEIVESDMIRNNYLRIEKLLWDFIDDPSKSQNEKLREIFIQHNKFVTSYLPVQIEMEELRKMMELNGSKLQSEFINVHRMFVSFQQHLKRETKFIDKGDFNKDVSLDLVDHILDDSHWPLRETLQNLHRIIVKDKLYLDEIIVSVHALLCTALERNQTMIL
jgi:hypothetical protein